MELLSFYVGENQHHGGMLSYDWLLKEARELGVHGGSVFRAIAGFGRHGRLHDELFIELAGELAVRVDFVLDEKLAEQVMQRVRSQGMDIFHVRHKVEAGII